MLEGLVVLIRSFLDTQDDVAIHLDETAVAVPGEALVAGRFDEGGDGLVVEAEVEDGVHHAGHRVARTGADGKEEGEFVVTELVAHDFLHVGDARFHLGAEDFRVGFLVVVVVGADLGGDREAGGDGESDAGHLGEVRAFAAEERLHRAVAIGFAVAPGVNVFRAFGRLLCGRFSSLRFFSRPATFLAAVFLVAILFGIVGLLSAKGCWIQRGWYSCPLERGRQAIKPAPAVNRTSCMISQGKFVCVVTEKKTFSRPETYVIHSRSFVQSRLPTAAATCRQPPPAIGRTGRYAAPVLAAEHAGRDGLYAVASFIRVGDPRRTAHRSPRGRFRGTPGRCSPGSE